MKLHRNAKSTPTSRLLLVRRDLVEGWSYAAATEGFAVSIRTVARWVRRFKEGGVAALEDASSRPGVPPHQTPPGAVALIRILREQHGLPAQRRCHHGRGPSGALATPVRQWRGERPKRPEGPASKASMLGSSGVKARPDTSRTPAVPKYDADTSTRSTVRGACGAGALWR